MVVTCQSRQRVDRDAQRSRPSAGENSITTIDALRIKSSKKCLDRLMTMATIKGNNFLDLKCDNQKSIQSNYVNDSSWPECISELVSRCARAPRAILNHALIGEYKQRFFLNENFWCPCDESQVEAQVDNRKNIDDQGVFFFSRRQPRSVSIPFSTQFSIDDH